MFAYFIQYNHWLYLILGVWFYIAPVYGLFYHCIIVTYTFVIIWLLICIHVSCDMLVYFILSAP